MVGRSVLYRGGVVCTSLRKDVQGKRVRFVFLSSSCRLTFVSFSMALSRDVVVVPEDPKEVMAVHHKQTCLLGDRRQPHVATSAVHCMPRISFSRARLSWFGHRLLRRGLRCRYLSFSYSVDFVGNLATLLVQYLRASSACQE